jgi:hypothetical protein
MAVTPSLVGEDDLAAANALNTLIDNLTIVVGPAVGAAILALTSPTAAFAINALSFAVPAVLLVIGLKPQGRPAVVAVEAAGGAFDAFVGQLGAGLRAARRSTGARVLTGFLLGAAFIYGAQTVALVLVSDERLGTGPEGYGYLLGALGAGGVIAAPLTNRLAAARRVGPTLLGALVMTALPLAALAVVNSPAMATALMVVSGAGSTAVDVLAVTLLQRALPDEVRGRVFGLLDSAAVIAILAGSLIVSPLVSALSLSWMLVILGVGVSALAVVGVRRTFVLDRAGAAEVDSLAPIIDLLAALPILELAQRPSIEQLAKASTVEEVAAGTTVIAQGEPADDLYAVIDGELEVDIVDATGRSETVAVARAGDYFGEVGLIHSVPRTATVSARTASRLVRVPGAAFLDALSSSPAAWARALEGATTRLGRQPVS